MNKKYKLTKEKMTKDKENKLITLFIILAITSLIISLLLFGLLVNERMKSISERKVLLFVIEELNYCVNKTNLTYEQLNNEFLKYKLDKLLKE